MYWITYRGHDDFLYNVSEGRQPKKKTIFVTQKKRREAHVPNVLSKWLTTNTRGHIDKALLLDRNDEYVFKLNGNIKR